MQPLLQTVGQLPKRLKTRAQFQAVLAGEALARSPHFVLHRLTLVSPQVSAINVFDEPGSWLGAMVPKRWAKRAVTRNAIKRQIYQISTQFVTNRAVPIHPATNADTVGGSPSPVPGPMVNVLLIRLRSAFDRSKFVSASSVALKTAVRDELMQLFGKAFRLKNPSGCALVHGIQSQGVSQ